MLSAEERAIVEELQQKYVISTEMISHLLQYRRQLASQPEKARVLPHFLELMKDVTEIRKWEAKRKLDNQAEDRRREARSVGEQV